MPSKVRGPFIEYECSRCGSIVRENAGYRDKDREHDRIVELNNDPAKRICAGCGHEP
jgi:DNA-directed RNA polymerase subunit RPC12/RpoP